MVLRILGKQNELFYLLIVRSKCMIGNFSQQCYIFHDIYDYSKSIVKIQKLTKNLLLTQRDVIRKYSYLISKGPQLLSDFQTGNITIFPSKYATYDNNVYSLKQNESSQHKTCVPCNKCSVS